MALLLLEARERNANFCKPWSLPPKEQEIMSALEGDTDRHVVLVRNWKAATDKQQEILSPGPPLQCKEE